MLSVEVGRQHGNCTDSDLVKNLEQKKAPSLVDTCILTKRIIAENQTLKSIVFSQN